MWPDRVSNPGPLTYKSGALSIALRGLAHPVMCSDGKAPLKVSAQLVKALFQLIKVICRDLLSLTVITKSTAVISFAEKL